MIFPVLETERMILSERMESDVDAMFEIFSDELVINYYDIEAFEELSQAQELIALFKNRFETTQGLRWGIRDRETNLLMGTCGYNSWIIPMKNAVIGYEIHPRYWHKGFAKEAVNAIYDRSLNSLSIVYGLPQHNVVDA